jgi:hypothetical protein
MGRQCAKQLKGEVKVEHGGFVHHHQIIRQGIMRAILRATGIWFDLQQAVDRECVCWESLADGFIDRCRRVVQGVEQAGGCLSWGPPGAIRAPGRCRSVA